MHSYLRTWTAISIGTSIGILGQYDPFPMRRLHRQMSPPVPALCAIDDLTTRITYDLNLATITHSEI